MTDYMDLISWYYTHLHIHIYTHKHTHVYATCIDVEMCNAVSWIRAWVY